MFRTLKVKYSHPLGHFWTIFLPVYFLTAAALDPSEVTNGEYLKFIQATRRPRPSIGSMAATLKARKTIPSSW